MDRLLLQVGECARQTTYEYHKSPTHSSQLLRRLVFKHPLLRPQIDGSGAYGPIYALSADVVSSLIALRNNSFLMFSNKDVTIGSWMLAMNVSHEDNQKLCVAECTPSSIAVWDIPECSGLCNPEKKVLELHGKDICSKSSTLSDDDENRA